MIGYYRTTLILGMALIFSAHANTETWQQLEREFTHYLSKEQESQLARWQQLASHVPGEADESKSQLLRSGKKEILRLLMETSLPGGWKQAAAKRLEKYISHGKVPGDFSLSESEKSALLRYLWELHPDPRSLTVLEWKSIGVLYGNNVRNAFLLTAFPPEHWPDARTPAAVAPMFQGNTAEVVYVEDGHNWNASGKKLQSILKKIPAAQALRKDVARLAALGVKVHRIALSPFPNFEDQARGLEHSLQELRRKTSAPLVILSGGIASAAVYRWLDLHPQNRDREDIRAWINWNGRLYGAAPDRNAENALKAAEASLGKKRSPAAESDWELINTIMSLQKDTATQAIPLGPGFPIFNFVPLAERDQPAENLRETLVPEGKVFVSHQAWHSQDLPVLIRRALNP